MVLSKYEKGGLIRRGLIKTPIRYKPLIFIFYKLGFSLYFQYINFSKKLVYNKDKIFLLPLKNQELQSKSMQFDGCFYFVFCKPKKNLNYKINTKRITGIRNWIRIVKETESYYNIALKTTKIIEHKFNFKYDKKIINQYLNEIKKCNDPDLQKDAISKFL